MHTLVKYLPHLALAASLGAGLMAGLFFAFSTFVMQALSRLPPEQGMVAMQKINAAVTTPLFGLTFFGTAAICLVIVVATLTRTTSTTMGLFLAGSLLYLLGVIVVTIAFNVPLNNALASTAAADAAQGWPRYVAAWLRWNHVRTITAVLSLACFAWGLFKAGSGQVTP